MSTGPTPPAEKNEPTTEELADQFAAQALRSTLKRAPDGLHVFEELAQRPVRQRAVSKVS